MSNGVASAQGFRIPRVVYVCASIQFLMTFGQSITLIPATRLVEGAVCRRYYGLENIPAENLCKSDEVQSDMAYLLGVWDSLGSVPGLLLTIPYGVLSEHFDRRYILLVNYLSYISSFLFFTAVCMLRQSDEVMRLNYWIDFALGYSATSNLKLLWISSAFDILGGGSLVAEMILRTIIAEAVPASSLSTVFYRLSGIQLVLRLAGVSFGSWLLQNGAISSILVGISILSMTVPLLTWLPPTGVSTKAETAPVLSTAGASDISISLSDMSYQQVPQEDSGTSSESIKRPPPKLDDIKADVGDSMKALWRLILHNRSFNMCLAIMFFNAIALGGRNLIRPWLSKRYDWTLAQTGYIMSFETILSFALLFVLQYFETASKWKATSDREKRKRELWTSKGSIICAIAGSLILCFASVRYMFFVAAVVISGSAGFVDAIKAYFTAQLDVQDIGRLYSTIVLVETLATIIGSPIWSIMYSLAYHWGRPWIGLPLFCSAGVYVLVLLLLMMLRVRLLID